MRGFIYPHYHLDRRRHHLRVILVWGLFSVPSLPSVEGSALETRRAQSPELELTLGDVGREAGARYISPLLSGSGLSGQTWWITLFFFLSFTCQVTWAEAWDITGATLGWRVRPRPGECENTWKRGRRAGTTGGENPTKAAKLPVSAVGAAAEEAAVFCFSFTPLSIQRC